MSGLRNLLFAIKLISFVPMLPKSFLTIVNTSPRTDKEMVLTYMTHVFSHGPTRSETVC